MFPSASRIRRQLMAKETRRARLVRRRRPARPAPPPGPAGACAFRRPLARTSAGRGPRRDPAPCSSAKCVGRIGNASGPNRTDLDAGGSRAATPPPAGGDRATGPRRRRAPCAAGFPRAGGARCPRTRFPRDRAEPAAGEGRARGGRSSRPVSRAARGSPGLAGGGVRGSSSDTGRQRCGARVPAQRLRPAPTTARDARAADSRRRRVPGLEQVTQE